MSSAAGLDIRELSAEAYEAAIPGLAALLVDAVDGGASVNFLAGVTESEAAAWWTERIELVQSRVITPFVAFADERVIGSVLLIRSVNVNSPHRAEIGKVLVHRDLRRRGVARALMGAAEAHARADGRWMLVLDTVTGSEADALYRSLGWHETGVVPDYALLNDGRPWGATFFWKDLR